MNTFYINFLLFGSFKTVFYGRLLFENDLFLKDSVNFKKFEDLFLLNEIFLLKSIDYKLMGFYYFFSFVVKILEVDLLFDNIEVLIFFILKLYYF